MASLKLSDAKVGQKIEYEGGKTALIGCVHKDKIYLHKNVGDGKTCEEHGTTWIIRPREDGRLVDDKGRLLKLLSNESVAEAEKPLRVSLKRVILDPQVKAEIIAVLGQHSQAAKLFDEWGLGEVIEYGRGMSMLFYGGPGTGKTMAAREIAKELRQELLEVGVDKIQTSEPGGANRNIVDAFSAARERGKILFFDEVDGLVTIRSEVGMVLAGEINTLLTELEKFEGVCIMATNRADTLDPALERRLSLIVEFKNPAQEQRVAIWRGMLPAKMPLGEGVSADSLAAIELTGGQIKNVVLSAARLAISDESWKTEKEIKVEARHFLAAIERVLASKNLLGSSSRWSRALKQDFTTTTNRTIGEEEGTL